MSLEGAKIICLNDCASEQNEIISAQGRTFKFGYYMDCDVVLEHPDAMGLQCTIDCDAFGRVTIENRCPDQTMTLNGEILKKIRPLLNNTEICIFDKKFLWQFEGNPKSGGFQMEDIDDFTTPCKQTKKAEQPPNSEPARRWRTQFNKRLTIYSFAYCIKANESPKDVEITTDENKPLNTYERIIPVDSVAPALATVKRLSVSPPPIAADLIDLKTPKARQRSLAGQKTPLSCCKLSETVITSYSPRETGVRPEKSFALVQSPAATPAKSNAFSDVSLGIIQHLPSPLTVSHRPSMHLIDLTTPKKRVQPFSPARTLLKSTLKKNIPTTSGKLHQRRSIAETITTSMESVYSVPSTDDESVIELSDEGNFSPSPVPKTPLRKTPQSLMKHAIISSAKKAAITKRLNLAVKQTPPRLMFTPPGASGVRFQSQSTPQRKSLGRLQSPSDSQKPTQSVEGKPAKSIFTSTPFRAAEFVKSKRSILHTPSTSLTGVKNKSRTSLMLKHALSKSLQTSSAKKRKSVSFIEATKSPAVRARKSVSFLERIESEGNQSLNRTFSIEEEKEALPKKDATFSPEKEKLPSSQEPSGSKELRLSFPTIIITDEEVCSSPPKTESSYVSEVPATDKVAISSEQKPECLISHSEIKAAVPPASDCAATRTEDTTKLSALQTPQSSRDPPNEAKTALAASVPTEKLHPNMDVMEDDDFEGLDAIFKTPKAKNLMILGSPKSISLQKPTPDSVELIHSTEFDLSANLDDIFKTPQSEFIVNRVEEESTPANVENMEPYSPEEAFDLLVGRPITRKTYANKTTPPKQDLPPLNVPRDNSLPKTDIEEWIDNVHDSIQLIVEGDDDDEDEMAFLTATQNEFPRHPLLTSSVSGSVSTTNKMTRFRSPKDESAMTIEEDAEGEETDNASALKDPLEMAAFSSPTKQPSPNISGIDLLDHTSESLFSETLEVSDESSGKESDKTLEQVDDVSRDDVSNADGDINISPDKARREMEEAFKNFEKERKMLEVNRLVSTPEPAKPVARVNRRKTMGSQQTLHAYFDVKLLKKERDMEIAFENFKKEPTTAEPRLCKTPDVKRAVRYESRKTTGNPVGGELDVNAIKAEREMKLAFENFIEKPVYIKDRAVQTPEPVKVHFNDHRRSMGSALVTEMTLDLKAVKAERDTELAFENFEENPQNSKERCAQTPEPKKTTMKDHRTTMGSNLVTEVTLDLEAAKEQLEMEKAFENFKDEPEFSQVRTVQTPEPKKTGLKDHRRTMGSNLVTEVTLDIEAVKAQLEMDQAFENFEDEPEFSQERAAQTPEPKKTALKDHRRTMGSNLVTEVTLDLEAAKEQLEMEQAFENFEDEPEFSQERAAQTPEPKKTALKDHRRTMGSNLVTEVTLDLEAAKEQLEMEQAFENFEDEPEFSQERAAQTPEPKKTAMKDHRRTMGSNLVTEVTLDLEAAKEQLEMEQAFENFEDEPEFSQERAAQTPEPKKTAMKDHRRTMGSNLVTEVTLDLEAAKEQLEMEQAFENFEDEPEFSQERAAQTPEPKKTAMKDHRRTMGSNLVTEVTLDLKAAKGQLEMEQAFENFEDEPEFSQERAAQTPEPKKTALKDHRRTMGSNLVTEVTLDLEAAKEQLEMEQAFENFEDEPEFSQERAAQTPEPKKTALKDHRRTMGSNLVTEVTLDIEAVKAQLEMEQAFENFEDEPEFSQERAAQTPEPKKTAMKDHRRTMGSNFVTEVTLDLEAAKEQLEMEQAFENFEDEPEFSQERAAQTPEPKKTALKDHRRTMGSNLVTEVTLDLEAAKEQLEMEQAFENFEDEPEFSQERAAQTPEPKKTAMKDHRRTMGSNLVTEVTLDLEAAKEQLEMEQAFENFEDEPEFSQERAAQTPEPKKTAMKDHRRTMGSNLVTEVTLDLEAAKEQLEMEQAFENFEDEPEFSQERAAQTPEPKKTAMKDHRRTMGSNLVTEVTLDLEAAKEQLEMEKAFENFEKDPTVERLKSTEASALEPSIRKENEELAPVMEISDAEDACETNQVVAVSDSDKAINEENNSKEELITQAYEQPSHSPRTRRRRQNTIDEVLEAKSNRTTDIVDIATIVPAQPKSRRRRQPTIDDVNQLKQQEETPQMQARTRRGRLNSVEAGSSLKDEHNHRVNDPTPQQPKTEIETDTSLKRDEDHEMDQNQTKQSASTLRKLVKKSTTEEGVHSSEADFTTSLSTEVTAITADSEIHNQLEPIAEEDKMVAAQIDGAAAKSEAKSIRLVADQNQDEFRENPTPKSVLNLNAEVDEIASTPKKSSSNRIRGRTAQLSVVLVESKNKSSPSVHGQHADEIKMEADVTCAEVKHEPTAEGHDADEVIQCTPAPTKTRGRRPAHKVESAEVAAPALRRGRRGSVQQDVDVKAVEQVVSPTPLPTKLRGRKGLLKGESTDGGSSPVVDLIPPTPEITRPRGRRAAIKVEASKTTTESVTPSRNRGRPGEDAIHAEEAAEAPVESVIKEENRRRSTHDIHAAAVVPIAPLTVQVLPVRKRGRKKANADPVLLTEESDVAVEEKDQMGSVENADGNKNEVAVPSTAEKAPLRKRGRKKAVADPNLSTDRTDVPPLTGSITSQRRSDFERSEAHVDKVASPPTDPSGEEKRKSLKRTDNASETSVASNEKSTPPRKRGRRGINANPKSSAPSTPAAALALETEHISDKGELVDTEVKASAAKRGRKKAVQDPNTNEEGISVGPTEDVSKSLSQTRRAGRKEDVDHPSPHNNIDPITPSSGTGEPLKSTTEESIPVDDCQANAEEVVPPNPEPPKKRGRKPKLANSVSDALTPNVSESTQLPIKTRGRRGVLKSESVDTDAESPAQKRARKRVIDAASAQITASETTEKVDDSEKVAAIQQDQTETEEAAPSTPLPSKPRGRRPALKAELIRPASSTPVRGRGRRAAEEPVLPLKIEPTTENANAGRKRGRKPAEKEEITVDTVKSEPIQPADVVAQPGRKGGRRVIVEAEILTEDDDVEKVIRSQQQTQQEASTSELTELLSGSGPNGNNIPAKKRGRPAAVKSEPTPESSTPVRKRGRKAAAKEEVEPTETAESSAKGVPADNVDREEPPSSKPDPPRARRLPAKLKESVTESITPRQRKARNPARSKCEEESSDFDQTPVKAEVTSSSRPIRSRRASAKEDFAEEPIALAEQKLPPVSEESENKPTRGRKAQPKKDATIDSTASHTEEELPPHPIKTKPTRGRKPTVRADTPLTTEKPQIEDTNKSKRGRKSNPTETGTPSEDEVEGTPVPTRKTTRNKVGAQIESLHSDGNQSVKKTARGRKATTAETDDGHSYASDTPKNKTRSRKVPQPVAQRALQRNMEIPAEDDQDCTPSKRIRRKPNILLGDEFVH